MTTSPRTPARTPSGSPARSCARPIPWRNHPTQGRTVPEVNDPDLREIPAYSWRILYHLRNGTVFIVTLIHKRSARRRNLLPDYEPPSG